MKFKFSLAPVLRVREHREKIQKQKLAEKMRKKQMICDKKSEIANQLEDFLARKDKHKAYDAYKLRNSYAHLEHAHQVMGKLSKDVEKADQAVSKERQKLMVAHQETNIMEKMKDHEYSAFNEELNRQERKELDEIVSRCYNR